jgi:type IV pilus assembly protein PilB
MAAGPYKPVGCSCLQQRLQGARRYLPGHAHHRRNPAHHPARRQRPGNRRAGTREGVRSLRESGLHKVRMGMTSLEEVLAVTNE